MMRPVNRLFDWRLLVALSAILLIGAGVMAGHYRENKKVELARILTGGDAKRASWLMIRYGCAGCHTIDGVAGADGQVGPPLKGLMERVYIGGTAPNTGENLVTWLLDPQRFSPHAAMPPAGLQDSEARDIAAYLYAH